MQVRKLFIFVNGTESSLGKKARKRKQNGISVLFLFFHILSCMQSLTEKSFTAVLSLYKQGLIQSLKVLFHLHQLTVIDSVITRAVVLGAIESDSFNVRRKLLPDSFYCCHLYLTLFEFLVR